MNPVYSPQVDSVLRRLSERLSAKFPDLGALLNAKQEETTTLAQIAELLQARPDLAEEVELISQEVLQELADTQLSVPQISGEELVVPPPGGRGLPRLNPHYEAALHEKIQFDGDIPESRHGPMPEGATPAVPVDTDARDPVALGWMLEKASEEVQAEIRQIEKDQEERVRLLLGAVDPSNETALAPLAPALLATMDRTNLPDPVGYERGQVPAPRKVEAPEGWALASLTPDQRNQLAWKFISTTQGRRTATKAILDLVSHGLRSDGYGVEVSIGEPTVVSRDQILAHAEWTVGLSGPGATQSAFAFIDVAARVLLRKLEDAAPDPVNCLLEVIPVNTVDVRQIGWAARLLRRDVCS